MGARQYSSLAVPCSNTFNSAFILPWSARNYRLPYTLVGLLQVLAIPYILYRTSNYSPLQASYMCMQLAIIYTFNAKLFKILADLYTGKYYNMDWCMLEYNNDLAHPKALVLTEHFRSQIALLSR